MEANTLQVVNWCVLFQSVVLDPCLDDCVMFAKRLKKLNNPVSLDILPGLPHGFLNFASVSDFQLVDIILKHRLLVPLSTSIFFRYPKKHTRARNYAFVVLQRCSKYPFRPTTARPRRAVSDSGAASPNQSYCFARVVNALQTFS